MRSVGEAFSYPFEDPEWPMKFFLGTIFTGLSVLIIGIPVVYGYYIEILQRMRNGESRPLPPWKDVGVKFIVGLKYLIVVILYTLPMAVVAIPFAGLCMLAGLHRFPGAFLLVNTTLSAVILCVVIPYSLFVTILLPLIAGRFSERERVQDALQVGNIFRLFSAHWRECVLAAVLGIVVQLASAAGVILFIIGILTTSFYAHLVTFHLYGQVAEGIESSKAGQPSSHP